MNRLAYDETSDEDDADAGHHKREVGETLNWMSPTKKE
jgi:hypothetical protein